MIMSVLLVAAAGFIISCYAFFIEQKIARDPSYKPACDLSDTVSCSAPITSSYGKLFGMSNAFIGIFFYAALCVLAIMQMSVLLFSFAVAACLVSVYLAGILYFRIRAFCILCIAIYLINALLLVFSYLTL